MGRLSLTYFGSFQASYADKPILLATNTARALFAYLALEAAYQPRSREEIASLLWPDHNRKNAYGNLRQTLTRMRKAIPGLIDEVLNITPQTLQFRHAAATLDVVQFEALLAGTTSPKEILSAGMINRLSEAAALYRGEFLQGVLLADSMPFDEWVMVRREQLHRQALDALHILTGHYESIDDYERMRLYAMRQLTLDPWREEAHAQLMRALAYAGRSTDALMQYEVCRRILSKELGVEPGQELRTLASRIRGGEISRKRAMTPELLHTQTLSAPSLNAPSLNAQSLSAQSLSAQLPKHNLPNQLTAFIGRERELSQILERMQQPDVRLLTLIGLGGMGKTRLALQIAQSKLSDFSDGVFFISLAPLTTASAIAPAIAAALGLTLQGSNTTQALMSALHHKRLLLILDNFEHLLNADSQDGTNAAPTGTPTGPQGVIDLLHAAPYIQIVVTSRERLNLRGEHIHVVQGLDYPHADDVNAPDLSPADAEASPAVWLFVQNARRVQPSFQLSKINLPVVLRLCQRVEGMPLCLELAAARMETLPLDAILTQIERSTDILAADWRDMPERQRSMRGVFEWSWNLLSPSEQDAFCRLSVCRGGFTLEAAETLTGASLWVLTSLLRKSLLRRSEVAETRSTQQTSLTSSDTLVAASLVVASIARYEIHELLRQFAAEKLASSGVTATLDTHEQHGLYYLTLAGEKAVALYSGALQQAIADVQADVDNIRRACQWAVEQAKLKLLHDYTPCLSSIFSTLGLLQEGRRLLQTFIDCAQQVQEATRAPHASTTANTTRTHEREWAAALKAKAWVEQARYLATDDLYAQAIATAQAALAQAQLAGDLDSEAGALLYWGEMLTELGEVEAGQRKLSQALSLMQRVPAYHTPQPGRGTPMLKAMILTFLAVGAILQKHDQDAHAFGEQSLRLCTDAGDRLGQARVAYNLVIAYSNTGDYGQARTYSEQGILWIQPFGNTIILERLLLRLGRILVYCGDHEHAHNRLQQALTLCQSFGDTLGETRTLVLLSRLACDRGDFASASQLSQLGVRLARETDNPQLEAETLSSLGDAFIGLHQLHDASAAYQQAVSLCEGLGNARLAAEPRAALASMALTNGNLTLAQHLIEQVLPMLEGHPRTDMDEPFVAYLVCVRVLQANNDPRAAAVLKTAHVLLQAYAERIEDVALKHSFMENVPAHRELRRCYVAWVAGEALGSRTPVSIQ